MPTIVAATGMPAAQPDGDAYSRIRRFEQAGDYQQAFILREETLALMIQDGAHTDMGEVALQSEELVRLYCCVGLDVLNRNDFSLAFELLQKAQRLVEHGKGMLFAPPFEDLRLKASAAVSNNLGLFYYRSGDCQAAVAFLQRACDTECALGTAVTENPGGTMLNLAQALIGCGETEKAVSVLRQAVGVLTEQARVASVLVQVEDANNLATHCLSLLGHCLEAQGDFHAASDTFQKCVAQLKSVAVPESAPAHEARLRGFREDVRRCQESAMRLPTIPLRSTRPAKRVHARDKRGTRENTHRLQLASGHPCLQHERIVTTTLPAAVPSNTGLVQTQAERFPYTPTAAADRSGTGGGEHTRNEVMHAATLGAPPVAQRRPSTALTDAAEERPALSVTPEAKELLPPGAIDVHLANTARYAPPASRKVFRTTDPGLQDIYNKLDPTFQEAFDALAKVSVGMKSSRSARGGAAYYPETALYGTHHVPPPTAPRAPPHHTRSHRMEYARPWSAAPTPPPPGTQRTPPPCGPTPPPTSTATHSAHRPASARQAGRANTPPKKSAPSAEQAVVAIGDIARASAGADGVLQSTDSGDEASNHVVPLQERANGELILRFLLARASGHVVRCRAESLHAQLTTVLHIREAEAARAQAQARAMLAQERARMQRELDEAKLMLQSRRRTSDPLAFTASMSSVASAVPDPASNRRESENLFLCVQTLLSRHAACTIERQASARITETLRQDIAVQKEVMSTNRSAAAEVVHRFARAACTTMVVHAAVASLRERGIAAFSVRMHRNSQLRKIEKFLLRVAERRRELAREASATAAGIRRQGHMQATIASWARTRLCLLEASRRRHWRVHVVRLLLQAVGRGAFARRVMALCRLERRVQNAHRVARAGKVILRVLRHNVKLRQAAKAWVAVQADNMRGKSEFSATLIQAHWRRHLYGRQPEAAWRARLARRQQSERLQKEAQQQATSMLNACRCLQRSYRMHLARRQLQYLRLRLERRRVAYFGDQWRDAAVRTLQAFCRIVRAQSKVRRARAVLAANARVRRLLFEAQEQERIETAKMSLVSLCQPIGRAWRVRRLISTASGRRAVARMMTTPTSPTGLRMPYFPRVKSSEGSQPTRQQSSVTMLDPDCVSSSSWACPSPSLFQGTHTSSSTTVDSDGAVHVNESLERAISATMALVRRQVDGQTTPHSPSSPSTLPNTIKQTADMCVGTSDRLNAAQATAGAVLTRFGRTVLRKKRLRDARHRIRVDTIRVEAAVFIQDAWRRHAALRRLTERHLAKEQARRATVATESATIIQRAFRRYRNSQRAKKI